MLVSEVFLNEQCSSLPPPPRSSAGSLQWTVFAPLPSSIANVLHSLSLSNSSTSTETLTLRIWYPVFPRRNNRRRLFCSTQHSNSSRAFLYDHTPNTVHLWVHLTWIYYEYIVTTGRNIRGLIISQHLISPKNTCKNDCNLSYIFYTEISFIFLNSLLHNLCFRNLSPKRINANKGDN